MPGHLTACAETCGVPTLGSMSATPAARAYSVDRAAQVTLVAESFGGALALRMAAAAPQLLERLVLVRAP
jgi:pimeloyl-ACP methyl ester carboxylesterase